MGSFLLDNKTGCAVQHFPLPHCCVNWAYGFISSSLVLIVIHGFLEDYRMIHQAVIQNTTLLNTSRVRWTGDLSLHKSDKISSHSLPIKCVWNIFLRKMAHETQDSRIINTSESERITTEEKDGKMHRCICVTATWRNMSWVGFCLPVCMTSPWIPRIMRDCVTGGSLGPGVLLSPMTQLESKPGFDLTWSHESHKKQAGMFSLPKGAAIQHQHCVTQWKVHTKLLLEKAVGEEGFQLSIMWSFMANHFCTLKFKKENNSNNNYICKRKQLITQ